MALTCELCGGTDFVKQDGMFVCQNCSSKYSVEEARKLMGVSGGEGPTVVKVDQSSELANLYELARRAKKDLNSEKAGRYYDQIIVKDPHSWEANFYTVYYQSMQCKIDEIQSASIRMSNCEDTVLELIRDYVEDPAEKKRAVDEIGAKLIEISRMLFNAAKNHYDGISLQIRNNYTQEMLNNCCAARDILYNYGDHLIKIFGDTYGAAVAAPCWKVAIGQHQSLLRYFAQKELNINNIKGYVAKVKKYDPSYVEPNLTVPASGGCYVATAVYGSYDCPQVWTLRRFRDNTLAETWYGRAFVRTYYAISPTLVKWFGKTEWFKKMWRGKLDRLVNKLNGKGVEDTPYNDRLW